MQPGDLTTLANVKQWLNLGAAAIAGITNANPAVVTLTQGSGFVTGLPVQFSDIVGMTEMNGLTLPVTVLTSSPATFSVPVDSGAFGTYVSGGFASVSDPLVERLISAVSTYIQTWMNRTVRNLDYSEMRDGLGQATMMFRNFPVTSVASLTIDGTPILPRVPLAPTVTFSQGWGYVFDDVHIMLSGARFCRGFQNVGLAYAAGFLIADEAQTVPILGPFICTTFARWSAGDRGVTYSNGTPLVAVASSPNQGQYSVDGSVYTFNALDAGAAVLISYGYVPYDLEQAAVDMIGDWFKSKDRIGKLSEAIEGQSITFTNQAITARAQGILNQYRNVSPIY
jgi:hypothetical protein